MLKNIMRSMILFITLFSFVCSISAYDYLDSKNEAGVINMIREIYSAKEQYEALAGSQEETVVETKKATDIAYWWPIGSLETTEENGKLFAKGNPSTIKITSDFNSEESFRSSSHKGLDIGSSTGAVNYDNVIASNSGVVIYPSSKDQTSFNDNGSLQNRDGGGYGNYVIIQHPDGNYTYYAHLAKDSITVIAGDEVERGQVIGKIGHSGSSTGPHLHFEIRTSRNKGTELNPLNYVKAEDPRPIISSVDGFSLTTTTLTRDEFVAKMNDYCARSNNASFCSNFAANAKEIYDAAASSGVNPELAVVTAGTEQSFKNCGTTNNFWGIGITNGKGCSAGPRYSSIADGVRGYAGVLARYQEGGSMANTIRATYESRKAAGADLNGIGLPGTYAGMQMIYSYLGRHEYGSSGAGGYYYMDPDRAGVTTIYSTHQEFVEKCLNAGGEHASGTQVTAWEQSRYTIFQMQGKLNLRQKIFGY